MLDDPAAVGERRPRDLVVVTEVAGRFLKAAGSVVFENAPGFKDAFRVPRYAAVVYDAWMLADTPSQVVLSLRALFAHTASDEDLAGALCAVHLASGPVATLLLMSSRCASKPLPKRARRGA